MPDSEEAFLRKLRAAFEIEAREHIDSISSGLLRLEANPDAPNNTEIIERTFRAAHSLKGAARSVDRTDIESLCQGLESIFARWKGGGERGGRETFDDLNATVSRVERMLTSAPAAPAAAPTPAPAAAPPPAPAPLPEPPAAAPVPPAPARKPSRKPAAAPAPAPPAPPAVPPPSPSPAPAPRPVFNEVEATRHATPTPGPTIRVPMARMDALLRQAEEMTGLKNAARQRCMDLRDLRQSVRNWRAEYTLLCWAHRGATTITGATTAAIDQMRGWLEACDTRLARLEEQLEGDRRALGGLVDGLLQDARTLSMLPFSTVLDPLPRAVRELARAAGKRAELFIEGRDIELDKRILEQIKDPLLHLVRNCIAHGIEPPEVRRARGKPEAGRVEIRISYRNATQVEIAVGDDGAGLDEARIKAAAVASGLLAPEEAERLAGPAARRLVFRSGVSTSGTVTEISGRGLGTSIVAESVEELGGAVDVESEPGQGATFRLLLPVTYATFPGVLVECGRESFAVPTANIERALRVPRGAVRRDGARENVTVGEVELPLARLRTVLGIESAPTRFSSDTMQLLVLTAGQLRLAVAVDEVREQMDLLLKPFHRPIVHARHFAAATLMPTGRAVLILNVAEVIDSAIALGDAIPEPEGLPLVKQARDILVTDDSVTSRMLLKNILESAGYRVKTASDGVDALAALRTQRFDLVVTDVQMPRMNGFDLTARIRADKHLGDIPVVLVTALESPQDRARGVEAGASAYIVKASFDQSNLLEVVENLI